MIEHWQAAPAVPQLPEGEIHLWRSQLDLPAWPTETLLPFLTDDERTRATRFRTKQLGDRFIVGRGTLRVLLSKYTYVDPREIQFAYTFYGKPYMTRPICRPIVQFNVAHAGAVLLIAFTRILPIGVDIEPITRHSHFNGIEIAARYFTAKENELLLQLPPDRQPIGFFNAWTRKEAFIKARGGGLSLPLDSFSVSLDPDEPPQILHMDDDPYGSDHWRVVSLEPAADYMAALVVPQCDWPVICFSLY